MINPNEYWKCENYHGGNHGCSATCKVGGYAHSHSCIKCLTDFNERVNKQNSTTNESK